MTAAQPSLALAERSGLPDALQVLLREFPKADWQAHPNFGEMVQFWMQRHAMFRQLADILKTDIEAHLNGKLETGQYTQRLAHYGSMMLQELHTHHHVEDSHYFPQLIRLDARLERGFDLLETDHVAMDGLLHQMADAANAVLRANSGGDETKAFAGHLAAFSGLLERHLTDEEEIVVPVILKTGFSG